MWLSEKFYDASVLAAISNTEWEGDIQNGGNKVIIRNKPDVTVNDYFVDQPLVVERPGSGKVDLDIDRGKYFNTVLDDVVGTQVDINLMDLWAESASEKMKIAIDSEVLRGIAADIITSYTAAMGGTTNNSGNVGATAGRKSADINLGVTTSPVVLTDRNAGAGEMEVVDFLTYMGLVLDEANIPESDRWVVAPPWMSRMLQRSELRDASLTGDGQSALRSGRIGMVAGFEIYQSNLLPTGTPDSLAAGETQLFFGHRIGLTFASQMSKMEQLRAESTFGTIMRGLQTYGFKVVDGTAIGSAVVAKA
jgi:hypothetical protein